MTGGLTNLLSTITFFVVQQKAFYIWIFVVCKEKQNQIIHFPYIPFNHIFHEEKLKHTPHLMYKCHNIQTDF